MKNKSPIATMIEIAIAITQPSRFGGLFSENKNFYDQKQIA